MRRRGLKRADERCIAVLQYCDTATLRDCGTEALQSCSIAALIRRGAAGPVRQRVDNTIAHSARLTNRQLQRLAIIA